MTFEFSKLKAAPKEQRLTDPIALFQRLRVTDTSINDLWLAQGDALREWNQNRTKPDISISLNTGAGKTLVGLLIGQSLVNEMRSLVLYACSSIQLIEQTAKKAKGYGLPITTYTKGKFSNDLAAKGDAVCLTTYQALFNGKSIFFNREIAGVVFDDSHAAEHLLRDHFSLRIEKDRFASVYSQICSEFSDYFHSVGLASSFEDIMEGNSNRLLMIPPFEVKRAHAAISKYLRESTIPSDDNTTFAWAHLKDRTDLCAFIVSSSEITITPAFVPSRTLPYFSAVVRRVYLSATLSALDVFVRTFGREPSIQIAPKTTAGECERMILIPEKMSDVSDDVESTIQLIRPHKTLLLVPSYGRSEEWGEIAKPPAKEHATEVIEGFKNQVGSPKLLLAGRYDGMDLPGDMCRVVVIDDLPSGIGLLERYLWEYLRFSAALRSAIASRIVQSFGRISRGMSDHGVAILTGRRLVEWLQVPKNLASLPLFLQKQLQLGFQMSADMNVQDAATSIQACLTRQRDWIDAYERFMQEAASDETLPEPLTLAELALAEAKYAADMWHRDYSNAASHLKKTLEEAGNFSVSTVCWHKLWLGYALELAGDSETARALYQQAHAGQRNIPPPRNEGISAATQALPAQALAAAQQFEVTPDGRIRVPRTFERDLLHLDGPGTTRQTEESLRCLGQYLGFEATRPDNEHGTGPDVLWLFPDNSAFCVDAKTDKEATSVYRKEELGQLADHVQWVRDNTGVGTITSGFIGPEVLASESANPAAGVKVANLGNFHKIGETLKVAYRDIAANSLPLTLPQIVNDEFAKRKLLWPHVELSFNLRELRDLGGH
jgi:tetratricopeptide (TPR) repeat protein